ncbi:MAG: nuclear transport factor 2 family protein [Bacteroidales bacterium]|nr:nuclear transport factor 2 family protein [Bacteroidales bacterium]
MKKNLILMMVTFFITGLMLKAQTQGDSLAIDKACRDYVEGWATGDMDRVAKGVSPELVKRTLSQDKEGVSFTNNMSASLLLIAAKMNKEGIRAKDLEPDKPFKLDVHIYDITGDYALVKTANTKYGFFDYCQLAKFNGEWKIFNVLWGGLPQKTRN